MAQDRQLTAARQARSKTSSSVPAGCRQAPPGTALGVGLLDPSRRAESGEHDYFWRCRLFALEFVHLLSVSRK